MYRYLSLFIAFVLIPFDGLSQPSLTLKAGSLNRNQTIVSASLDVSKAFANQSLVGKTIVLTSDGEQTAAQWFPPASGQGEGELVFVLERPLKAGESRTYTLELRPEDGFTSPYKVERVPGDHLLLLGRDPGDSSAAYRKILRYNDGIQLYEPDPESHFSRSGYIHPLWSPQGHVVTGDRCPDHPHQRGCFFAWTKCTYRGEEVNFWALDTGRPQTSLPPEVSLGPVAAVLRAYNHLMARGVPALEETLTFRAISGLDLGWVIDVTVEHEAVSDPLQVEQYLYGGMAFRGPALWLNKELVVASSEGVPGREADLTRASWCQMAGPMEDGTIAGVTYFDFPSNPRYPTFLRIHPEKPYFCFAYHQREGVHIDKKHPLQLRYRVLVHDTPPSVDDLQILAADMANPPAVEVDLP